MAKEKEKDKKAGKGVNPEPKETAEERTEETFREEELPEKEDREEKTDQKEDLIAQMEQKIAEGEDRFKRLFAEFDNFRKRSENEKAGRYADGERAVLEKILPTIDNFDRALANIPEDLQGNAYVDGMEKVYRSFMDTLASLGVKPIEAVGQPFDADFHNAVMHVEDEDAGENMVVEEFQKGYMFKDKVLRYSMVKVAN